MKIIMSYFLIFSMLFICISVFMNPVSAKAPEYEIKVDKCGVPIYNSKYITYNDQNFNLTEITLDQFKDTPYYRTYIDYYNSDSDKPLRVDYVKGALRCFFSIMEDHNILNLLNGDLQIGYLDISAKETPNNKNFYLWSTTPTHKGDYTIYLYNSYIHDNKNKIYYTIFHEMGHMLDLYYIDDQEMIKYRLIRNLIGGNYGYIMVGDKNRDHDIAELFSDDVAISLIPESLYPDFKRGTLKTKKDTEEFRKFLFKAIKNK